MATRNRTLIFRKYRDALKSVRAPSSSSPPSTSSRGGPVIELVSTSLLNPNRSYAPLSTDDPGGSRYSFTDLIHSLYFLSCFRRSIRKLLKCIHFNLDPYVILFLMIH